MNGRRARELREQIAETAHLELEVATSDAPLPPRKKSEAELWWEETKKNSVVMDWQFEWQLVGIAFQTTLPAEISNKLAKYGFYFYVAAQHLGNCECGAASKPYWATLRLWEPIIDMALRVPSHYAIGNKAFVAVFSDGRSREFQVLPHDGKNYAHPDWVGKMSGELP